MFKLKHLALPIVANAGGNGYYHVAYSQQTLDEFDRIAESALTPAERISLLNDVWSMVNAGMLPVGDYLSLVEGLKNDRLRPVVEAYAGRLGTIEQDMASDAERDGYRAWVRDLLRPAAQELGWQPRAGETTETTALRATILRTLGQVGHDATVLASSNNFAHQYLSNIHAVDPTMADAVVNLAALQGDEALYNDFLLAANNATSPEEYYRFLYALARFGDPALLTRTLQYALTPSVRGQDFGSLLSAVMTNPAGTDLAWNFLKEHWAEINSKPPGSAGNRVLNAAKVFCDTQHRDDVASYARSKQSENGAIQETLEDIGTCSEVKQIQEPNLAAWIQHRGAAAGQSGQ